MRDGDRDTWTKETYGKKEPLGILPFNSLAHSHQANAWPKILVSVSLLLQGLFLHADGVMDTMCLGGITVPKELLSWNSLHSTMLGIFNSALL